MVLSPLSEVNLKCINSSFAFSSGYNYNNYSPKWKWLVVVDTYRGRDAAR